MITIWPSWLARPSNWHRVIDFSLLCVGNAKNDGRHYLLFFKLPAVRNSRSRGGGRRCHRKKKMKQIRPSGVERMSRFVRHRFMPMAVGYAALRRCHQFECIFLFCLSHLHNDPAIKREYFELLKVFDSICTKFGPSNFLCWLLQVASFTCRRKYYKIIKLRTSTNVYRAMVSRTHRLCVRYVCVRGSKSMAGSSCWP